MSNKPPITSSKPLQFESSTPASDVLDPWSGAPVATWDQLQTRIDRILKLHGSQNLVWRGVIDARWGLYSSLYRRLKRVRAKVQESDMVSMEERILNRARNYWRFDKLSALEIFAHVQHYGGPTRLLDVTFNPLIATWFAVEQQHDSNGTPLPDTDCRVFCFYAGEFVNLDKWGGPKPPWFDWRNSTDRLGNNWGTGDVRRIWKPPAYNERISAQNGAFLIDGVPFSFPGSNTFTKGPGNINGRWKIGDVRDASSVPVKFNDATRGRQTTQSNPAFTFRIEAAARAGIRERLESNYGYSVASLYSDLFGLAQYVDPSLPK